MVENRRSRRSREAAWEALLDGADRLLETFSARVALSFLILLSIMPLSELLGSFLAEGSRPPAPEALDLGFYCIFAPEFAVRSAVYLRRRRRGRASRGEFALLMLDLVAALCGRGDVATAQQHLRGSGLDPTGWWTVWALATDRKPVGH